jgi:hypothetical protein
MYFNGLTSVLAVLGAYFAVLAFGVSCAWLAGHRRRRRDLRSVGVSDSGGSFRQEFYRFFTRRTPW